MFTVIFAEKENIKLFRDNKVFFEPLYDKDRVAFCEWNPDAGSFDTMAPGLYSLIDRHNDWRALVLCNSGMGQQNPYDFVGYNESYSHFKSVDWNFYKTRRRQRLFAYECASRNPLVKLTTALCGIPRFKHRLSDEELTDLLTDKVEAYEYMLKEQLKALNCHETAFGLGKYKRNELKRFVSEENADVLLSAIDASDVDAVLKMVPASLILDFIKFLGNDPLYYDPEYTDRLIETTKKQKILETISEQFRVRDKLPSDVFCLSQRTLDLTHGTSDVESRQSFSYAEFENYNLYNEKLKLLLFDILPKDDARYKFDQIKYLCFTLVLASNDVPTGVLSSRGVYSANVEFKTDFLAELYSKYIGKLRATKIAINDLTLRLTSESTTSGETFTPKDLFRADVTIPIEHTSNQEIAFADSRDIGLTSPSHEQEIRGWEKQYHNCEKKLIRYLREPRRAVKNAVFDKFRKNNRIDDDRTLHFSDEQKEDLEFHIAELEQQMVEMDKLHLYDTEKFFEQIQESEKEVKRGIYQRISTGKALLVGAVAFMAYLIGFLPLLFSNRNTGISFNASLILTGAFMGTFMALGYIYLYILRQKSVNLVKRFNQVIGDLYNQINYSLSQFSHYISNACNCMRSFSALKRRESTVATLKKILQYHDTQLSKEIENVNRLFSKYVDFNDERKTDCTPYDYNYTVMADYVYDMPSADSCGRVEYLQCDNWIDIPIDCFKSVMLTKEEFHD